MKKIVDKDTPTCIARKRHKKHSWWLATSIQSRMAKNVYVMGSLLERHIFLLLPCMNHLAFFSLNPRSPKNYQSPLLNKKKRKILSKEDQTKIMLKIR